ncbi:hypothetical protein D3C75_1270640 [compost metagenome]
MQRHAHGMGITPVVLPLARRRALELDQHGRVADVTVPLLVIRHVDAQASGMDGVTDREKQIRQLVERPENLTD